MQKEGQKLEMAELDAREKAAGELKTLHGKELVDAGLKQMGHGVLETVKGQVKGTLTGVGLGAMTGALSLGTISGIMDRNIQSAAVGAATGAVAGAAVGGLGGYAIGYEAAGIGYNRNVAQRKNLPPARWFDWVLSHGSGFLLNVLLTRVVRDPQKTAWASLVLGEVINPISVGGLRNVATGLWQMRKG